MPYSKTLVKKMMFHFDTPYDGMNDIPEDIAKEIESFGSMCVKGNGKIGFSNSNAYDRKRLEVFCEESPVLKEK